MAIAFSSTKVSVSKALKYKNRIAGIIGSLSKWISNSNSIVKGNPRSASVVKMLEYRSVLVEHLLDVKHAISKANIPVQRSILEMAERKSDLTFLRDIDTFAGSRDASYRSSQMTAYESELTEMDVAGMIARAEQQIDDLQDALDTFNAKTCIDVDIIPAEQIRIFAVLNTSKSGSDY